MTNLHRAALRGCLPRRHSIVARASLLVSNEVSADGFTRGVFDRLVVSNILRAKNRDFAMEGVACFYRLERRRPQYSSNRSPTVREPHGSCNADIFFARGRNSLLNAHLHEQRGHHSWSAFRCDLIDYSEIVIHLSRAEIESWGTFATNPLLSLNLWRSQ